MVQAQLTLQEIMSVVRRRRKMLLFPFVIVSVLSLVGAYILPRKFESSTTILVQREEILNPLVRYEMALTLASEDRLRTFNEIIYSGTIIQSLIDSLEPGRGIQTEGEKQALVKRVRRNVSTDRRGSDSFRITYVDTDPLRAKQAASLLANLFIQTKLDVENRRNELTVLFFENELQKYRKKFEASQKKLVTLLRERIGEMPTESRTLYTQLEVVGRRITDIDTQIKDYQQAQAILRTYPNAFRTEGGKRALYELQRADLPHVSELRTSLVKYDEYSQRYTVKYPAVEKLEVQILELLERMDKAVESEIRRLRPQQSDLEKRQTQLVDEVKRSFVVQKIDQDIESDYDIYRDFYDDMKLKLEQARMTRALGNQGADQFIIIDPAIVPTVPSRPNRMLIILGGFVLGLILSVVSVIALELFDTKVRTLKDIEVYQKPVIALIPDTQDWQNN